MWSFTLQRTYPKRNIHSIASSCKVPNSLSFSYKKVILVKHDASWIFQCKGLTKSVPFCLVQLPPTVKEFWLILPTAADTNSIQTLWFSKQVWPNLLVPKESLANPTGFPSEYWPIPLVPTGSLANPTSPTRDVSNTTSPTASYQWPMPSGICQDICPIPHQNCPTLLGPQEHWPSPLVPIGNFTEPTGSKK